MYGDGGHGGGERLQPQAEGSPLGSMQNKTESLNDLEGQNPHSPLDWLQTCGPGEAPSDLAPLLAQSYFESGTPQSEDAFRSIGAASSQTQPFFPQTCQRARMSSPE